MGEAEPPNAKPSAARRATIVLAACGLAATMTAAFEGRVLKAAPDPVGIPTACYGHTADVKLGQQETPEHCLALLTEDEAIHGYAIDACIHVEIPLKTRAAFTDFAFNVGSGAFCRSTLARKLNAGDLPGACAELSKWTLAAGKTLPGLVRRRAAERAWCEAGLKEAKPASAP